MSVNDTVSRRRFFKERIPLYQKDPVLFAGEVLRFDPDSWQREAENGAAYPRA